MRILLRMAVLSAVVVCTLLAALLVAYIALGQPRPYSEADTIGDGIGSFAELSDRFTELAKEKGGVYAFEILKRAPLPPGTDLHLLGHAVGDVLYTQKGVDAIADCTQDFRNACSHSVVIGVLIDHGGDSALPLIDSACHKAPGGLGAYTMCYHGLGHGVFAFMKYSLSETVAFCKKMGTKEYNNEQYTQCVSGAVMELMGGGGHDKDNWQIARNKYLSAKDPLAPCDTSVIPDEAKPMCYIYLTPHVWEVVGIELGNPDPRLFAKAFSFCDKISTSRQQERDSCFGGFGKEFIPLVAARDIRAIDQLSDGAYGTAAEWCMLTPLIDGQKACIGEEVSSLFWGGENDPQGALHFCALIPQGDIQSACYQKLAGESAQYVSSQQKRQQICAAFPNIYKSFCKEV